MRAIFEAASVPVTWDEQRIGTTVDPRTNSMVTRENLDAVLVREKIEREEEEERGRLVFFFN